jgi:hypothetical protein
MADEHVKALEPIFAADLDVSGTALILSNSSDEAREILRRARAAYEALYSPAGDVERDRQWRHLLASLLARVEELGADPLDELLVATRAAIAALASASPAQAEAGEVKWLLQQAAKFADLDSEFMRRLRAALAQPQADHPAGEQDEVRERAAYLSRMLHALGHDCENTDGWEGAASDCFEASKLLAPRDDRDDVVEEAGAAAYRQGYEDGWADAPHNDHRPPYTTSRSDGWQNYRETFLAALSGERQQ